MKDLKQKTIRVGLARLCAQAANFLLRVGSLDGIGPTPGPKDFGLVGMVTAFTGVLSLFRDFGLSSAAVQRATVTEEQISTLFWINVLVGALLALMTVATAPVIAAFYHEPRLFAVTAVLAAGFLFNALGIQHSALLQRQMRFTALAVINTLGMIVGTAIAIGGAKAGLRILGSRGDDCYGSNRHYDRFLADHSLGAGDATQANWDSLYDPFRWDDHFEWPGGVYRQ